MLLYSSNTLFLVVACADVLSLQVAYLTTVFSILDLFPHDHKKREPLGIFSLVLFIKLILTSEANSTQELSEETKRRDDGFSGLSFVSLQQHFLSLSFLNQLQQWIIGPNTKNSSCGVHGIIKLQDRGIITRRQFWFSAAVSKGKNDINIFVILCCCLSYLTCGKNKLWNRLLQC